MPRTKPVYIPTGVMRIPEVGEAFYCRTHGRVEVRQADWVVDSSEIYDVVHVNVPEGE